MSISQHEIKLILVLILLPTSSIVYGHGLGIDTISSINIQGEEISISVEMPMNFENEHEQVTITATNSKTKENVKNVTFLVGLFHDNKMIFRNYFFAENGVLPIKVTPTHNTDEITFHGNQDSLLGAWTGIGTEPVEITGPLFIHGGLYNFEIEIRTINKPNNIIDNSNVYKADLSVIETKSFTQKDSLNNNVEFITKSYFDKISNLNYNPETSQVTFEMPFDWNENQISHISLVHVETRFFKNFTELVYPNYIGYANGVKLFKDSVVIDDYTDSDSKIIHFILLNEHLRLLKNELTKSNEPLPNTIEFLMIPNDMLKFPLTAYTKSEDFKINLAWEPTKIEPGSETNFIITIRDSATNSPIKNSEYTFVIIQNDKEIYRTIDTAIIGGHFEKFTFGQDQTGPTTIKFENIDNSGQETEFDIDVAQDLTGSIKFENIDNSGQETEFDVSTEFQNIIIILFVIILIVSIIIIIIRKMNLLNFKR